MKRLHVFFVFIGLMLCSISNVSAQTNSGPPIIMTPSDTVLFCPPEQVVLSAQISPNNPIGTAGINVSLTDDSYSGVIPIGFSFEYYGELYTQCVIGSNNYITFDLTYANSGSGYVINMAAPSTQAPRKSIMCPWQDINPGTGGIIRYQTIGQAPNRIFIVEYCSVPMFSCTGMLFSDQIKIFETTNVIEMHVIERPLCDWNNYAAIQGLTKDAVTADIVPGRNYTPPGGLANAWTVFNDGYRFTPKPGNQTATGLNNGYVQEPIPFAPFLMEVTNASIEWFEGASTTPIGTGPTITVAPATETYFVAKISSGGQCVGVTFTDTVFFKYGSYTDNRIVEICAGSTYDFFGKTIFNPGIYDTAFLHDYTCDSFFVVDLRRLPLPDVSIKGSASVEICEASSTILSLKSPESTSTFQWSKDGLPMAGETSSQLVVTQAGTYIVEATTDKGCKAVSEPFRLKVNPNPIASIEPISGDIICAFDTLTLKATPGAGYDYRWTPEKAFRMLTGAEGQEVKGVFLEPITPIVLTVYNQFGCYDTATAIVNTKPCCEVFMPNAFSPNGDGNNDFFKPLLQQGQILLTMQIFDRWGKLVYNSDSPKLGWNGKYDNTTEAPSETYMYFIKYTCSDGNLYEKKESVTLIR